MFYRIYNFLLKLTPQKFVSAKKMLSAVLIFAHFSHLRCACFKPKGYKKILSEKQTLDPKCYRCASIFCYSAVSS